MRETRQIIGKQQQHKPVTVDNVRDQRDDSSKQRENGVWVGPQEVSSTTAWGGGGGGGTGQTGLALGLV